MPKVDLAQLLGKASEFARLWHMQEGCGAHVLDDLADAVVSYLGDNPQLAQAGGEALRREVGIFIDDPIRPPTEDPPQLFDLHAVREAVVDAVRDVGLGAVTPYTLPSEDARALLAAVLRWRDQGHESRWKTPASRALVQLVDDLRARYPSLCDALTAEDSSSKQDDEPFG